MLNHLPYDPGVLPTRPAPVAGESIAFRVPGLPPYKQEYRSIRNVSHPRYESFVALRQAGIAAMDGRAWYHGPVRIILTIHAPKLHKNCNVLDYAAGVEDTLDGSSGYTFTYLPIAFEDDCQVCDSQMKWIESADEFYEVSVEFLAGESHSWESETVPEGTEKIV